MAAQQIHHAGKHLGRIIFRNGHNGLSQCASVVQAANVVEDRRAPGIIHGGVQLTVHKVPTGDAVGPLVGGVLPDLAKQQRVGLYGADAFFQLIDKFVGQLIHHIQAEAIGAQTQPVGGHRVVILYNIMYVAGCDLLHVGQRGHIPPGIVVVGIVTEAVPLPVRRVRIADGAVAEDVLGVKIDAVAAGVRKNAVEDNADAQAVGLVAEDLEVRLCPQHGVDAFIIGGIVAVVGVGHENGVEVDHLYPQVLEVGQLFPHAVEVTAEKVAAPVALAIGLILRHLVPVRMDRKGPELIRQITVAGLVKAVRQDLVHDRAPGKVRRGKIGGDDAELPLVSRLHIGPVSLLEQTESAVFFGHIEPVEKQAAFLRHKFTAVGFVAVAAVFFLYKGILPCRCVLTVLQHEMHTGSMAVDRDKQAQNAPLPRSDTTERGLVGRISAVKQDTHYLSFQIFSAYSSTERSEEKIPALAILTRDILENFLASR